MQPPQPLPVQHRDGSYYPAAAVWAVDGLPRRVREGEERERTVGQVLLAGTSVGRMISGRDGTWTPEIQRRLRTLGIRVRIRLENHVEMKVAQMMINTGSRTGEVLINHVPCGSLPRQAIGCHQVLERYLPSGYTVTVHGTTQQGAAVLLDLSGAGMTIAALTSLAARDEIEIAAIRQPGDLTTALVTANDQRGSSSGRVWFLVTELDVEAPCLVVGVRGEVGALEWIDDERFVPANGVNLEWVTYYTAHLHDNSMPPRAELPLADVLAAAEEYVRTGRRPMCVDWTPEAA